MAMNSQPFDSSDGPQEIGTRASSEDPRGGTFAEVSLGASVYFATLPKDCGSVRCPQRIGVLPNRAVIR